MIARLKGLVDSVDADSAVIDVGASYTKRVAAALCLPNVDPGED